MIGQTISHYRILEKLGEGGMGVVYLAEDTNLARQVAIKFLSASQDHSYRARFLREARAVSKLSHPNIAIIHDYGETSAGQPFIVMEYVSGETLSELLNQSALTIGQVLEIAEGVAEALAAAHAHGIIHRDIKPSNVIVSEDGSAKVLDFGLVKHLRDEPMQAGTPDAATLPAMRTSSNVIVGTPLYLSPEQATGGPVDARSDLFALGALLYESLTGKAAFAGGSVIEIGAQVIHFNPPPPSTVNRHVPAELDRITLKALAKKPEARYQSAADLATDLRAARTALKNADRHRTQRLPHSPGTHSSAFKSISETLGRPRVSLGFFGLALVIIVLAFWYVLQWSGRKSPTPFQEKGLKRLTTTGKSVEAAISPDGQYVVYAVDENGKQSLLTKHVVTASNFVVAAEDEVTYQGLTFTKDNNYIYYVRYEREGIGVLYQASIFGGANRKLMADVDSAVTFSPDGKRIAFVRNYASGESAVIVSNVEGLTEQKLSSRNQGEVFVSPAWSPDGKGIVCGIGSYAGGYHMSLVKIEVDGGTNTPVSSKSWYAIKRAAWLGAGTGLVINATDQPYGSYQLWFVGYPGGEVRRITDDLTDYRTVSLAAGTDTLVTVTSEQMMNIWVVQNTQGAGAQKVTSEIGQYFGVGWLPDGRLVYSSTVSGDPDIWITDAAGQGQKQLTLNSRGNYYPAVSPDGRYIVFASNRLGHFNIWRMDADGGNQTPLTRGDNEFYPSCSPDGRWVFYQILASGTPTLWRVPIDGGQPQQISNYYASRPVVSPDGKLVSCTHWDDHAKSMRLAIFPSEGGPPTKLFDIPVRFRQSVRWLPDSRTLVYIDARGGYNLWALALDGGTARQLTDLKSDRIFDFDLSRDGKQFALTRGTIMSDVLQMRSLK